MKRFIRLFFKESQNKRTIKPIRTMNSILLVFALILLIMAFLNDTSMNYMGWSMMVLGLIHLLDGIENYLLKESMGPSFGLAAVFCMFSYTLF
ncbi:hypothetical protein FGG79_02425 [Bacillus sp. BHET2]|uniref:hypothetical protein n=1 Tax=Bacillus sp. BHET2 TaxID=2583818 RepID=UPI00110F4B66|nr:hypothetical protein [Bacillus sp. BHET2]TMU87016.1 hypothetical protein FGG79_02425 [Bacillus sp. BHET2]